MTSETRRVALGSIAEIIKGVVPAKPSDTSEAGVPFVGLTEITTGGAAAPRTVDRDDVPIGASVVREHDVLVALLGNIGASALATSRHAGAVLGRECVALRTRGNDVTGAWVYVWTQSTDFQEQVERLITGTTMPRLGVRGIRDMTLPVPSRELQDRASELLHDFDEAIVTASDVLSDLTSLRRVELQLILSQAGDGLNGSDGRRG